MAEGASIQEIKAGLEKAGVSLQKFTAQEQACISGTISKEVDGGKPMDQAIAIAIQECAPGKADPSAALAHHASITSEDLRDKHVHPVPELDEDGNGATGMASGPESEPHRHDVEGFVVQDFESGRGYISKHPGSLQMSQAAQASLTNIDDLPGGKYDAIDNGDGTFDILDVPIVAELKKGEKNAPFDINRQWHLTALVTNQRREAEGHMAPLKIHHPQIGVKRPERVGFMSLTRVGTIRMDGRTMSALFARLRRITAAAFLKIQKVELPYRSVEANWTTFEVDALALLDSEVPFHRMEMLTVGQVEKASVSALSDNKFALAYCSLGSESPGRGVALFNLGPIPVGVKTMAEAKKDAKGNLIGHEDEDEKPKTVEDRMTAMETAMGSMQEDMTTIKAALEKMALQGEEDPEEKKKREDEEAKAKAAAADEAAPAEILEKGKMQARLVAAEGRLDKRDKQDENKTLVDGAVVALAGYHLDEKVMVVLQSSAEQGKEYLGEIVEVFKANLEKETPDTEEEFEVQNAVASMSKDSVEFAAANGDTPEMRASVAKSEAAYKDFVDHTGADLSLKDWLESEKYVAELKAEEAKA